MEAGRVRLDSRVLFGALLLAVILVGAACSPSEQPSPPASAAPSSPTAAPSTALVPSSEPSAVVAPSPTSAPTPTLIPLERPLASKGSIAVVRADGTLWMVDVGGRMTPFADAQQGNYGFPAWSPDGSKLASIRTTATGGAIAVFDLGAAGSGAAMPPEPKVIFQSTTVDPFYLSWSPDGKQVSFLANDAGSLALRIAAADGSSVLDGTGPGAVIRTGSPLYFDWIDPDHLFAHIGTGAEAFLGEIDRAGDGVAPAIPTPGTFRSVDVSHDGKYVGYVRAGTNGKDAVVVAQRDASHAHSMPVFDIAAVGFSPTADVLAAIGSTAPVETPVGFPNGPLRLLDARSGKVRTLLDGQVVGFSWSPDGKTIAALRLVEVFDGGALGSPAPSGSGASAGSPAAASASPVASAAPSRTEIRLTFIDVASGDIRSDPSVTPSITYINAVLAYFDQYSLSHRLWAPDSSSIILPELAQDGSEHIGVLYPDGASPVSFEGTLAFWSP